MEAAYVEKVRRGGRPTREEADAFLRAWHARHPAATSRWRRKGSRDAAGHSSYDILAACVPAGSDARVLDVACGDGELLALLHARLGDRARLVGVDMSDEDVALARARGLSRVEVRCEKAQQLAEGDAAFDAVLCHYALMLINPLAPVAAEIARVLAPGGVFAAVVPGRWDPASFSAAFAALLDDVRGAELPGYPDLGLGDPEYHAHGVAHFFNARTGFDAKIEIAALTLSAPETPEGIWEGITNLYWFDLVRPEAQERLRREGMPMLAAARDAEGLVQFRQEARLVKARRAG